MIYIIRHGQTDINKENRVNDVNQKISINKVGIEQANKTGIYLKKIRKLNINNTIIYTSPQLRAFETAEIIKNKINKKLNITLDKRLVETNKGILSGLGNDSPIVVKYNNTISNKLKGDSLSKRENILTIIDNINSKYNIENTTDIAKRLKSFFNHIKYEKKNIIIITHSGVITNILAHILNILVHPSLLKGDLSKGKNCSITTINNKGKYTLLTFPNTEHL